MDSGEFQRQAEQVDRLVQRVGALADEDARTTALDLLHALMDLHGAVVIRIVEVLSASESGRASLAKLGSDPLICGLLVLYGVHPLPLQERVSQALEKVRSQLRKQGADVELLGVSELSVRVKLQSTGAGCGSSPDALKRIVEQAILEAAPEIAELIVDGAPSAAPGFVPLNSIQPVKTEEKKYEESAA
jgi:Fe-S cluster biogenesis protein NfuA